MHVHAIPVSSRPSLALDQIQPADALIGMNVANLSIQTLSYAMVKKQTKNAEIHMVHINAFVKVALILIQIRSDQETSHAVILMNASRTSSILNVTAGF